MNRQIRSYGPWTTSLDAGWQLELSRMWRRRMNALPLLVAGSSSRRRSGALAAAAGGLMAATPLLQPTPTAVQADEPPATAAATAASEDATAAKDEGSELLRKLQRKGDAYLKFMRDDAGYRLAADENVKLIAPPFSEARMRWYLAAYPSQAEAIPRGPDSMLFHWEKDKLRNWGMSFGGHDLDDVLHDAAEAYPERIEGEAELRETDIAGDWVVRPGAPRAKVLAELEAILNRELKLGIRLRLAQVERDVFVVRGAYKFAPLPGQPKVDETQLIDRVTRTDPIQVFGKALAPDSGSGGGTGDFDEFCEWVGRWVETPLVNEAEAPPRGDVSWRLHQPSPFTDEQRREAHDARLVLANIAKQTGLTFERAKRSIEVVIVERVDPEPKVGEAEERLP